MRNKILSAVIGLSVMAVFLMITYVFRGHDGGQAMASAAFQGGWRRC